MMVPGSDCPLVLSDFMKLTHTIYVTKILIAYIIQLYTGNLQPRISLKAEAHLDTSPAINIPFSFLALRAPFRHL
jgi:hypothetical protein